MGRNTGAGSKCPSRRCTASHVRPVVRAIQAAKSATVRAAKKRFGVRVAMFFLPVIALGGYAAISLGASFGLVKWIKALENGTDYSIMNTSRHALFLITTRREKYKAKAAVDTFFHRSGDALSALLVFIGTVPLAFPVETFAVINVAAVAVWMAVGAVLFRLHKRRTGAGSAAA